MRVLTFSVVACVVGLAACAAGTTTGSVSSPGETPEEALPATPLPAGGTGFDEPAADAGGASSGDSGTSGSSGGSSSGASGSSSSGASGSSSSGASGSSSGGSSSGASGSSSGASGSSSSSGGAGGACAVCDRNWTCNNFQDYWQTQGARCVNQRTATALRCDHKFDQGSSYNVGTWSGDAMKITLVYPMLGGGTKSYDCFP